MPVILRIENRAYFNTIASGFSAIRNGRKYEKEQECGDHIFITTVNFECDSKAKYSITQPNITQYVSSIERIPTSPCYVSYA